MLDRIKGTVAGIERYLSVVVFVLTDSIGRYRGSVLKIVVLSSVGSMLELAAMFAVVFYASTITKTTSIDLLGVVQVPRDSTPALAVVLVLTWLLLVLASRSTCRARIAIVGIGRQYEGFCAARVFETISKAKTASAKLPGSRDLFDLARKNSQVMGRVLRILMEQTSAIVTLSLASAVMLYHAPMLTGLVFCLACTSLVFQARVSRHAAQASVDLTDFSRKAAQAYKAEISARLAGTSLGAAATVAHPDVQSYAGAFDSRLKALAESRWISGVMIASILVLIVLMLGIDIFERDADWEVLLVYLIGARFALTSVRSLLVGLTSINRFYPKLQSYRNFQVQADRRLEFRT